MCRQEVNGCTGGFSGQPDLHFLIRLGIAAVPLSNAARTASTSLGRVIFRSSSKAATFWKMEVLESFSFSPLLRACSTRTCRSFCISGYVALHGSSA
ncbi:unnamed protein product [Spirodela intermedia]|uniref:Uncharacterized protein n=1 Tax=Spirodela intermedia TaxID=51605 RepID=A0A7I8ICA0_SPIIN|nr:unnamed protein product [Spirodela intermedia]CAA6655269.1 unnamed protein product [Spirodela intermedia]